MSLFNTRPGSGSGASESDLSASARIQRLKALRKSMADGNPPPRERAAARPPETAADTPATHLSPPRRANGHEANWTVLEAAPPAAEEAQGPDIAEDLAAEAQDPATDGDGFDAPGEFAGEPEPAPEGATAAPGADAAGDDADPFGPDADTARELAEDVAAFAIGTFERGAPGDDAAQAYDDPSHAGPLDDVAAPVPDDLDFLPVLPDAAEPADLSMADPEGGFAVPGTPQVGRGRRGGMRNRTRLLGFDHSDQGKADLFANAPADGEDASEDGAGGVARFPVGWVVVAEGPGAGHAFTLYRGVSHIGRGENQRIRLDFGDTSISRENHAAIAYDDEDHSLTLAQGGKANLVRLNGRPVLSNETLNDGDVIRIGTTRLRVVQLCNAAFNWNGIEEGDVA